MELEQINKLLSQDDIKIEKYDIKFTKSLLERTTTKYIFVHHTKSAYPTSIEMIHDWHLDRGWKGFAYNFYVRKNGEVFEVRGRDMIGGHTKGFNDMSVGVCCEGDFDVEIMSTIQLTSTMKLIKHLYNYYKNPSIQVLPHSAVADKTCPGMKYPRIILEYDYTRDIKDFVKVQVYKDSFRKLPILSKTRPDQQFKYDSSVEAMQKLLNNNLYAEEKILEDGKFGILTQEKVKDFQELNNLKIDGIVGAITWERLFSV